MNRIELDWDNIDTVCLDMDGTLLDLHFDNHFWLKYIPQIYADDNKISLEQSKQQLFPKMDSVRGHLEWYCLDYWSKELGLNIAKHKAEIAHLITPREGAIEFLDFVKQSGKQQLLVTNAHRDSLDLKIATIEIKQYFHHLISSHDYGMAKEHPEFWQNLQRHHPIDLSRTLFIDDSDNVLVAAQKAGIKFVLDIAKPDSKKPKKALSSFPQLQHFSDIMNYA